MTACLVLVTGAAGALGTAAVDAFVASGAKVLAVDRHEMRNNGKVESCVVDLTDPEAEAQIKSAIGGRALHHLVGIAGGALAGEAETQDDPVELGVDLFRASVDANLVTQFVALRSALPALRAAAPADRSVTLTSTFNAFSAQGMPAYSAAKAGLIGMMHALVGPLGHEGIRINVVAPGTIRTPRTERLWSHTPGHFERLKAGTAMGRLGTPEDVAEAYLACSAMTHVTGQVLTVDGGQTTIHR